MTNHMRPDRALRGLAVAVLVATPASSNDLVPYTVPIWTGAYAGLHGGVNWLDIDTNAGDTFSFESGFGGIHLGINQQSGQIVFGGEVDINYETAEYSLSVDGADYGLPGVTASGKASQTASGSVRARVGLPISESTMLYATGGYAWTAIDYELAGLVGSVPVEAGSGSTFSGLVYGIGAESIVMPNVVLRIEALRYDYAEQTISLPGGATSNFAIDPSSEVIRAGVSWRFN